jgi:hypothetical protein
MSIRDAGTTIRQSSTALLTIDSEDRFATWADKRNATVGSFNWSPYNFSLIRNAALVNGYMTRVALTEVQFPWVYPNINNRTSNMNFTYRLVGVSTPNVLNIPVGFYTPAQLAAEVLSQVNDIEPCLASFQYGANNLPCFSYTAAPGYSVSFAPMDVNQQVLFPVPANLYPYSATTKQLFDVLGFASKNTVLQSELTLGNATLAQALRYVDIVSPELTANQGLIDSTSQPVGHTALCRLYIGDSPSTANFGDASFCPPGCAPFVIYRQFQNAKQVAWNAIMPVSGSIRFQVYDDNGELLIPDEDVLINTGEAGSTINEFEAYTDWSITLLLSEN